MTVWCHSISSGGSSARKTFADQRVPNERAEKKGQDITITIMITVISWEASGGHCVCEWWLTKLRAVSVWWLMVREKEKGHFLYDRGFNLKWGLGLNRSDLLLTFCGRFYEMFSSYVVSLIKFATSL